jgi:DNA-binding NtrC family response regulator
MGIGMRTAPTRNAHDWASTTTARAISPQSRSDEAPRTPLAKETSDTVSNLVAIVAPTTINVLVHGGCGTDNALVATTIHGLSKRRNGAFIRVDCSELPSDRLAAELCGYVSGSPPSPRKCKRTCFERAFRGTLFLDDVEFIPDDLQRRLLRILQDREVLIGSGKRIRKIDIRLIAASKRDLAGLVKRSSFDRELYNLLKIFEISMPEKN